MLALQPMPTCIAPSAPWPVGRLAAGQARRCRSGASARAGPSSGALGPHLAVGRAHTMLTVAPFGQIAAACTSPTFRKRCTPTATANGGQFVSGSFDGMGGNFDCKMNQSDSACTYADVQVANDNDEHPDFSKIDITVESTPGLLRLITWVLTGLDVKVQTAQIRTDELTGIGQYTFYVLNAWGEKLRKPEMMMSRLEDFLSHCRADHDTLAAQEVFKEGRVCIEQNAHPTCTRFTVDSRGVAENKRLLDTVSVICALGLVIVEADLIDTGRTAMGDGKQWRMLLRTAQGTKLDGYEAAALLFVMSYVFPMSMCGTPLFEQQL